MTESYRIITPLKKKACLLAVVAGLLLAAFGFQGAPQEESLFGEYIYYDFMDDYSVIDKFTQNPRFTRYTSYAILTLNPDSTYSYFNVQGGIRFTRDSGSFYLQGSTLTFSSEFKENDLIGNTYYAGPYITDPFGTSGVIKPGIYINNLEFIDLQACDSNCLTVFFSHNMDSSLSYIEFALGSKHRTVKLRGEFLSGKKSYYFKYPRKKWKEEELFTLSVNVPELHFAQQDYADEMYPALEEIKNGAADTLIIGLTERRDDNHLLYSENAAHLPQHLHGLKMLREGDRLYLRYKKKPERKVWVWDRKYNWLQKKGAGF